MNYCLDRRSGKKICSLSSSQVERGGLPSTKNGAADLWRGVADRMSKFGEWSLPWLLAALMISLTSCSRQPVVSASPTLNGEIVARVNDQVITRAALQQQLSRRGHAAATREQITTTVEELVRTEAVYAKARAAGFDTNAAVQTAIKKLVAAQYEEELLKTAVAPARVTGEEMEQYYRAHQAEFTMPERVRVAIIFRRVPAKATPEKQAEHTAAAAAILAEAQHVPSSPEGFGALVMQYSEDPATRYQGGDTGWLVKNTASLQFSPEVADGIFALQQPGDFTPVMRTKGGVILARLEEKQAASTRPFSEVKESVAYRLVQAKARQREAQFAAALKAGLDIVINRPLLDTLARPVRESNPPGLPGVATTKANAAPDPTLLRE